MGFFGSATTSIDRPTIRNFDMYKAIRELVLKTQKDDLEKLKHLKHENIVSVISLTNHDIKNVALVTEYSGHGSLLQKVLAEKHLPEQLVSFVAQISQGVQYLHDNNIIHGDLRAEHIMVFPNDKVKVSRLGRSKAVGKILDTKSPMPEDAVRWSPPEVIKDGTYSHSSDVYSFGIVCYELFDALDAAKESKTDDVKPFPTIEDNQILAHLQANKRPTRPQLMPIWVHLVAKQCLLLWPSERPPFVLIEDALTSCKPFESCLLYHWVKKHENEADNIDVNVTQSMKASHVIPKESHQTFEKLRQLAAVEVFLDHTYVYAPRKKDDEDDESAYEELPLALNSEDFVLVTILAAVFWIPCSFLIWESGRP
ncbi:tyrosine-protein kinase Yes-like [Actinia tenebrosa]|uniref:Tyrosine-protein kinase Yes-like n=1 Tax=Actinia tenebrosa TaxID=6105 RepID=A0A6P8ID39_ACTTE|nr:tyrosine-protein kinase Yes-like [Actinia tenebrosa]